MKSIAVVGATGVCGRELLTLLEERHFPYKTIRLFASPRSKGNTLTVNGSEIPLEELEDIGKNPPDLTFFCAGQKVSQEWIPKWPGKIIDLSSHFRQTAPLIIPEINRQDIQEHSLLASPNCVATLLLLALFPLHKMSPVKRIVGSTYQAASGGGYALLEELKESKGRLPFPYALNLFPHNTPMQESGYAEEEEKIQREVIQILKEPKLKVTITAVRVPVLRAHSLSLNVEFYKPVNVKRLYKCWEEAPGIQVFEDRKANRFATPWDVTGKNEVFVGRVRQDISHPNAVEFWVVGDQLRKGAALNAIQIAETIYAKGAGDSKESFSLVTG